LTVEAQTLCSAGTLAERAAADNWSANLSALEFTQPRLVTALARPAGITWIYGRDGALTAMHADGSWWAGCSLPRRAARSVLKTLDAGGRVACFLAPPYAAQVQVALEMLRDDQAIVVLCPRRESAEVMLGCENFAAEIRAHRLWFACGEQWSIELDRLFEENPGLPTPAQFIRGAAADHAETNALIPIAEKIFNAQNARRAETNKPRRQSWQPSGRRTPRICLIAPSHFRLWDDGGHVLAETMGDSRGGEYECVRFDSDDPASASSAALAVAASGCDAAVAVNLAREDLPDVLPDEMPWVTWLVRERIAASVKGLSRDGLIVADARLRSDAIARAWPSERVQIAAWPRERASISQAGEGLAMIADTRSLKAPPRIVDLSSQHLLWDAMAAEIAENPFVVTPDADKYLRGRQRELQIPDEGFDRDLFVERLLTPAFGQGIARLLRREKLAVRLWGEGWQAIEEFADIAEGPVRSRRQLAEAAESAAALVYAWPIPRAHPIDALARPILRPALGRSAFLASARNALAGRLQPMPSGDATLTWVNIVGLVNQLRNGGTA
jgi:hypothetical protein